MSNSLHPLDCSPPGSSVHRISQARIPEWVAISFSRESRWPRDWTCVSCIGRRTLCLWATREAPKTWGGSNTMFQPGSCQFVTSVLRLLEGSTLGKWRRKGGRLRWFYNPSHSLPFSHKKQNCAKLMRKSQWTFIPVFSRLTGSLGPWRNHGQQCLREPAKSITSQFISDISSRCPLRKLGSKSVILIPDSLWHSPREPLKGCLDCTPDQFSHHLWD